MTFVTLQDTDINEQILEDHLLDILKSKNLLSAPQVSITSVSGNDDWFCSVGKIHNLKSPERYFSTVNESFKGTYIEDLIQRYPEYYRWRIMRLEPRHTYTIHQDSVADKTNLRLHIPVVTNPGAYLCFFKEMPSTGKDLTIRYEHLDVGNSYVVNTTGLHTAVNYGTQARYHIVGVRYEDSNNRS